MVQLVDPAPYDESAEPDIGTRLVAVQLRLTNTGADWYSDAIPNGARLVDDRRQEASPGYGGTTAGPSLEAVAIAAGDTRLGFLVFPLATDRVPTTFQWAPDSGFAANRRRVGPHRPRHHARRRRRR